jgi:hypothetical protein
MHFASSNSGTLGVPMVGEFKNGRGEFYDQEEFNGKTIQVRFVFSSMTPTSGRSEQAFSDDGGKTWEVNWINNYTRLKDEPDETQLSPWPTSQSSDESKVQDGQRDFDFNLGTWKTHIKRLEHPLTGSTTWFELNGIVTVTKVWNGRGQIEEVEADGPHGHFEDLALFLYNPQARQWSQSFANSRNGILGLPMFGEFKNGRGEFYDQEEYNGRNILARVFWKDITPDSHTFEQSFSDDGGKTWEVNMVANLTRDKD